MFLVDTNVFVYAANGDSAEHSTCFALVDGWRRQDLPWYTTWPIVYELLRVLTHPSVLPRPRTVAEAWGFVTALLESPSLTVLVPTERHRALAATTFADLPRVAGNLMHDAHTAIVMREHGIRRIVTRDRDFAHFPFLEAIDPLEVSY